MALTTDIQTGQGVERDHQNQRKDARRTRAQQEKTRGSESTSARSDRRHEEITENIQEWHKFLTFFRWMSADVGRRRPPIFLGFLILIFWSTLSNLHSLLFSILASESKVFCC